MVLTRKVVLICALFGLFTGEINAMPINHEEQNQAMIDRYEIIEEVEEEKCDECYWIKTEISFYTGLVVENSKHGAVDAQGNALKYGTIAIPREYDLGLRMYIEDYGDFVGRDRGSRKHIRVRKDGVWRIDMYQPRLKGESDSAYYKRVNNLGKVEKNAMVYCKECLDKK